MKSLRPILAALALCASPLAAHAEETPTAYEKLVITSELSPEQKFEIDALVVEVELDVVRELLAEERRAIDRWTALKLASVITLSPSPSQIAELRAAELEYLATRAAREARQDRAQAMLDALTRSEVGR